MTHLVPSYLKNAYCGRGASETPSALRCLFYLINSFLTGITWLKTSRGSLFLPPSNVYVRSFLCLFYTLINLYHTKALSNRAPSLAPGWIPLLQRPRILVSFTAEQQRIDALELWCWRTLESPLDYKEIKPVNPKGNQPWIFIGRTVAEALILWPSELIGKDLEVGKDWGQEEKWVTGWAGWMPSLTQQTWVWANSGR